MNSYQVNKFVGAFLASILVIVAINMIGNALVPGPDAGAEDATGETAPQHQEAATAAPATAAPATAAPTTAAPTIAAPVAAEPAPEAPSLPALLAAVSADDGRKAAKVCRSCHTFDQGGSNRLGPNLWGIVGAKVARADKFRYSDALRGLGGTWGYTQLFEFLANPKAYAPGTRMIQKVKKPGKRAKVIAYLRSLSDDPLPLPVVEVRAVPEVAEIEMPDNPEMDIPATPETVTPIATPEAITAPSPEPITAPSLAPEAAPAAAPAVVETPGNNAQPPTLYIE